MKRYFIVSYSYCLKNNGGFGFGELKSIGNRFPNSKDMIRNIKKQYSDYDNCVVLNIMELSEKDHYHYME